MGMSENRRMEQAEVTGLNVRFASIHNMREDFGICAEKS